MKITFLWFYLRPQSIKDALIVQRNCMTRHDHMFHLLSLFPFDVLVAVFSAWSLFFLAKHVLQEASSVISFHQNWAGTAAATGFQSLIF